MTIATLQPQQPLKSTRPRPIVSISLALLISLSPVIPFPALTGTGYHDGQRIVGACFFALTLTVAAFRLLTAPCCHRLLGLLTFQLLFLFTTLGLLSALVSISPRHAFYEWANLVGLTLTAWVMAQEVYAIPVKIIDTVILLCGIGCGLYILQALLAHGTSLFNAESAEIQHQIIGFDNFRFLNHIQTIGLPMLGLLAVRGSQADSPKYANSFFWMFVASMWWMLTFVSAGRGTFVGVWAGAIAVMLLHQQRAYPWFRVMVITCAAGLVAYFVLYVGLPLLYGLEAPELFGDVLQRTVDNPTSSRLVLWQLASELVAAHSWLGVGPLHYAHYAQQKGFNGHPHNFLFQIAAEWGLPALFTLTVLMYFAGKKMLQINTITVQPVDIKNQTISIVMLATGIAIAVDSMVSGLLVMPSSQLWVTLYAGCAWGWAASRTAGQSFPTYSLSLKSRFGAVGFIVLLLVSFLNGLWPEILELRARENTLRTTQAHEQTVIFKPRLWRFGYF